MPPRYTRRVPRRLQRALLRETAGLYPLGVAAICLLLCIDFLSVLARFLVEQDASVTDIGALLLYRTPWFLHLALPVAVVFAVLITGGRLAKDSELKAAYAMGVPPMRLFWPLVLFGLVVGALSLVNNGFLEPRGEAAYQRRIDAFVYARPPAEVQVDSAYRIEDAVYYAARIRSLPGDHTLANLEGVVVQLADGTLYSARTGQWDSVAKTWRLTDAQVTRPGGSPTRVGDQSLPFSLASSPNETLVRSASLSLDQVWSTLRSVERAGGDTRDLAYELHRRLADALSSPIFAAFAAALALRVRGRAAGFAWTIVLMVGFWATWLLSGNLFQAGAVGPLTAAWLTPTLAAVGAGVLATRTLRS